MLSEVARREGPRLAIVLFVYRVAVFVGLFVSCVPDNRASFYPAGRLSLDVELVDFRETPVATTAEQVLSVANLGTELLWLELAVEPANVGFSLSRTEIPIGRESSVDVVLRYSPLFSAS